MSALLSLLLASFSPVFAQQPAGEIPAEAPVATEIPPDGELQRLREALAAAEAETGEAEALVWLLETCGALIDPRYADDRKIAAATALGARPDPRAWPFLASAVRNASAPVRVAALTALTAYPTDDTLELGVSVLRDPRYAPEVQEAAMRLLVELPMPAAGEALYRFVTDTSQDPEQRRQALALLRERRPEVLAAFGEPPAPAQKSGAEAAIGVGANTVAGGILLSSVGALGQSEAGVVIGAIGGSMIGAGTGITYALTRPVSLSQNLQYAAGVGWGLDLGVMTTFAIYGERDPDSREEVGATLRAAGVGLGAGLAFSRFKKDIDPIDVAELNASMWIGQQLGLGVASIVNDPGYGYGGAWDNDVQVRMGAGLAGAVTGAGVGMLARERWDLDSDDAVFAGVTLVSGTWMGGWLPFTWQDQGHMGVPRVVGHGLTAGALLASELVPVSTQRSLTMGYGYIAGNALGAGVPMLARLTDEQPIVTSMLAVGALGGAAGFAVGDRLEPEPGDYALIGIGLPIVLAEATALGGVMYDKDILRDLQFPGVVLTSGGVGAAGLLAAGHFFDPQPGQVVLVGTAAAWGAWYGALTPIALDLQGDTDDLILASVGTADVFMLGAGLAQLPVFGLQPRRTLIPQLGGVGGATLGALVVGLATADGQAIAGGAVVGSLLGFGGGTITELALGKKRAQRAVMLPRPNVDLPGVWSFSGMPMPDEEGAMGLRLDLSVVGW